MHDTLVIVADSGHARVYGLNGKTKPMTEVADFIHAESRMRAEELISDRKGRTFDSKGSARHAKEYRSPIRDRHARKFAGEISAYIETERKKNSFDNLVLIAAPGFLGLLRKALGKESGKLVSRQIDKDLVLMPEKDIRKHLAS